VKRSWFSSSSGISGRMASISLPKVGENPSFDFLSLELGLVIEMSAELKEISSFVLW